MDVVIEPEGKMKAELCRPFGEPRDGFRLGDCTLTKIKDTFYSLSWKKKLRTWLYKEAVLRFSLEKATIFAVQIRGRKAG